MAQSKELRSERGCPVKNRVAISAIVLVIVFLAGFLPPYLRARRLDADLQQAQQVNAGAELRDLAGLAYLQANQKNYGLAAGTLARYFNRLRAAANQAADASRKKSLEELLSLQNKLTTELAQGDAAANGDLQDLFTRTRRATGATGD